MNVPSYVDDNSKYHVDFYDIKSVITYIIHHYEKFLLLIFVVIIVYIVDHINNINAIIYGITEAVKDPRSSKRKKRRRQ
jgi:hypothetical protein